MKIGVSLAPAFLCGVPGSAHQKRMLESSGGADGFLQRLRDAGADWVELRAVRPGTEKEEVSGAAHAARKAGVSMTVHGTLTDEPAEVFWERMKPVLAVQPALTVTVHSAKSREETVLLLGRLAGYALRHHPQARLMLENNRSKAGDNMDLVECAGVLKTLELLNRENVGACWDFGHFYWDCLAHPELLPDRLPPEGFIARTGHTHIHSVLGNTTHFPLTAGELPLREYAAALMRAGYQGVFNLEPEPERWAETTDAAEEIVRSVGLLRSIPAGGDS